MRTINYSLRVILNFHWLQESACGTAGKQIWQWDRGLLRAGAGAWSPPRAFQSCSLCQAKYLPHRGAGSTGGSWSTVPACHELTEARSTEQEPPGTPRACLGCCTVLQKAVLDPCFSSCADTQMNQGFIALQDTFFPAVRQKPSAQVL